MRPLNDYVRRFVASMNPLTVLKGGTLMRPVTDLKRDPANPAIVELDRAGRCRVTIDAAGRPGNLTIAGQPGRFIEYATDLDLAKIGDYVMVTGNQRTPMRGAVLVRQITKRPLILLGPDGELMGVVGEHELYRGMLKQTDLGQSDEIAPIAVDA
jgi:glycine betaine/proline transport system ATP-binding protein